MKEERLFLKIVRCYAKNVIEENLENKLPYLVNSIMDGAAGGGGLGDFLLLF